MMLLLVLPFWAALAAHAQTCNAEICNDAPNAAPSRRKNRKSYAFGFKLTDAPKSVIFVGNPGVGKSALLNGYIGKGDIHFKSGVSMGNGMTSDLDHFVDAKSGVQFFDTPGLADPVLRDRAVHAIGAGLRKGGDFKVMFVVTLESGRVRPQDVTTAKMVLDSAHDIKDNQYALVFNKISKSIFNKFSEDDFNLASATFLSNLRVKTRHIHFIPKHQSLDDEDNVKWHLGQELPDVKDFFDDAPVIQIFPQHVKKIEADFEGQLKHITSGLADAKRKHEEELKRIREQITQDQKEHSQQISRLEQQKQQLQKEHAQQLGRLEEQRKADKEEHEKSIRAISEQATSTKAMLDRVNDDLFRAQQAQQQAEISRYHEAQWYHVDERRRRRNREWDYGWYY